MQSIYVHLDSISNHVLSSSVHFQPTVLSQNEVPKNILLLKEGSPLLIFVIYTDFILYNTFNLFSRIDG